MGQRQTHRVPLLATVTHARWLKLFGSRMSAHPSAVSATVRRIIGRMRNYFLFSPAIPREDVFVCSRAVRYRCRPWRGSVASGDSPPSPLQNPWPDPQVTERWSLVLLCDITLLNAETFGHGGSVSEHRCGSWRFAQRQPIRLPPNSDNIASLACPTADMVSQQWTLTYFFVKALR